MHVIIPWSVYPYLLYAIDEPYNFLLLKKSMVEWFVIYSKFKYNKKNGCVSEESN